MKLQLEFVLEERLHHWPFDHFNVHADLRLSLDAVPFGIDPRGPTGDGPLKEDGRHGRVRLARWKYQISQANQISRGNLNQIQPAGRRSTSG